MVKFIDINTGNTFNGDAGYCHWFDGEQSVDLIYNKSICFVHDAPTCLIKMQSNPIFKLLDPSKIEDKFKNLNDVLDINDLYSDVTEGTQMVQLKGVRYMDRYVYMIYISASAEYEGEYIEYFHIDDESYLVGADFYNINESLYVNLSNNGVRIPTTITKAFYDTNVHEDKVDHILLNRKFKELLSNYWDVMANKGSYKSLYNSLNWFEYGNKLKLYELWKQFDVTNKEMYHIKKVDELVDHLYHSNCCYLKTTYISLGLDSKELETDDRGFVKYDNQSNPILKDIVYKWSKEDLILKMFLLGEFYKTFFTPIHVSLLYAAMEDLVFSDTIKIFSGAIVNRNDFVCNTKEIKCNISNGQKFGLSEVKTYYDSNAVFYTTTKMPGAIDDLTKYSYGWYDGIGAVVDVSLDIPLENGDEVKKSTLWLYNSENLSDVFVDYKILSSHIDFQLLLKLEGCYKMMMQFETFSGDIFTKSINLEVVDTKNVKLKLYKLKSNDKLISLDNLYNNSTINEFSTILQRGKKSELFSQNILKNNQSIKLNKLVVLNLVREGGRWELNEKLSNTMSPEEMKQLVRLINDELSGIDNYFMFIERNDTTICIGKKFGDVNFKLKSEYICGNTKVNIVKKNNYIFCPEFHENVEFPNDPKNINDYIVTDKDVLCIKPDINMGKLIEDPEWVFTNVSSGDVISIPGSVKEPFILPLNEKTLSNGYYNVTFNYRLGNTSKTLQLNSAFIKK